MPYPCRSHRVASSDLPDETDPTEETAKVHSAAADTDAKNRLSRRKLQIVGSIFFFLTSIQAYVGVKCVSFHFADELSSVLMCISVLLINIEICKPHPPSPHPPTHTKITHTVTLTVRWDAVIA